MAKIARAMLYSNMKKISLFCFLYGKIGHGESFYPIKLSLDSQEVDFGWDLSIRAPPRKVPMEVSKWLREDNLVAKSVGLDMRAVLGIGGSMSTKIPVYIRNGKGKE